VIFKRAFVLIDVYLNLIGDFVFEYSIINVTFLFDLIK